jgi:hypothetical protein
VTMSKLHGLIPNIIAIHMNCVYFSTVLELWIEIRNDLNRHKT